ncbi:MAG: hypothetical protein ACFB8W_22250 [Elainellaceae cyanobacterium]
MNQPSSPVMDPLLKEQLILLIEREMRYQLDDIIQRMQQLAKDYGIGEKGDKRSPLRNLLVTATDRTASLEVIKNYIDYQTARSEDIGKVLKALHGNQKFGKALIDALDGLEADANTILNNIASSLPDEHPVKKYLVSAARSRELTDLHLNLAQLYLGYLVREHTALREAALQKNRR